MAGSSSAFPCRNASTLSKVSPVLFETRVTGGWLADQRERYATIDEARAGHESWVARVREVEEENQLPPPGGAW